MKKLFYSSSRVSFVFYYTLFMWIITCLPILIQRYELYYIKYQYIPKALVYLSAEGLLVYTGSLFIIGFYTIFPNIIRKILLSISGVLSVAATYSIITRGTYISDQLIVAILRTNKQETSEMLITSDIIIVSLLTIIVLLPVWLIKFKKYEFKSMLSIKFWYKKSILFLIFLIFGGIINVIIAFSGLKEYDPTKSLRTLYPPVNYLNATFYFVTTAYKSYKIANNLIPLYDENNQITEFKKIPETLNLVIVIGESARQQNHQVYGYNRETTPNMVNMVNGKEKDIFALTYNATSCGTYTVFSVSCMLSPLDKKQFKFPISHKGILSIYDYFGFQKYWITTQIGYVSNNSWSFNYFMADRYMSVEDILTDVVAKEKLLDTHMLPHIKKWVETDEVKRKVFIVHLQGSHGDFKEKYPSSFEKFKVDPNTDKRINVDAYDNSILFTDHVLQELVNIFKDKGPMLMLYTSDHGESLGEVYYGQKYIGHTDFYELKEEAEEVIDETSLIDFTAPEQYKVPMYLIFNKEFEKAYGIDVDKMKELSTKPASHDNVFSTVLDCVGLSGGYIKKDKSLCVFK